MSSPASELNDDPRLFAPGVKWSLLVCLGVLSVFAYAIFGWSGVAGVLAVPLFALLVFALTLAFVALMIRSVVKNTQGELDEVDDDA